MEDKINKLEIELKNGKKLKLKLADSIRKIPCFSAQTIPPLDSTLDINIYLGGKSPLYIIKRGLLKKSNYVIPRDSIVYMRY